jgi:hypothetical protein
VRFYLLAGVLLFWAATARAQNGQPSPYSGTVYKEGPGFRLGHSPLVVHPGLAIDIGYDSNVFYLPYSEVGSALLRLRGHIDLATLPPQSFVDDKSTADQKIDFRFSTQVEYREYLTNNASVESQRSINALVGADLNILPRGPFTLALNEAFVHSVDPRNGEVPKTPSTAASVTGQGSNEQYTRDFNRFGFLGTYRRGGFEIGAGDYFQINIWETPDLKYANSFGDEGQLFARVHFLPQTFGQVLVKAGYLHYWNQSQKPGLQLDARPVRALIGASTLFTRWLGAAANIGYGNSLNYKGAQYNMVIGSAEVRLFMPLNMRLTLGWDRDFYDSVFANYYVDDHLFIAFNLPVVKRVAMLIDGGVRFRHYDGLIDSCILLPAPMQNGMPTGPCGTYTSSTRNDQVYEAHVELSYRLSAWLALSASYNLLADRTNFGFVTGPPQMTVDPARYVKHAAFFRADFAY